MMKQAPLPNMMNAMRTAVVQRHMPDPHTRARRVMFRRRYARRRAEQRAVRASAYAARMMHQRFECAARFFSASLPPLMIFLFVYHAVRTKAG